MWRGLWRQQNFRKGRKINISLQAAAVAAHHHAHSHINFGPMNPEPLAPVEDPDLIKQQEEKWDFCGENYINVDRFFLVAMPLLFLVFNIVYWFAYGSHFILNSMKDEVKITQLDWIQPFQFLKKQLFISTCATALCILSTVVWHMISITRHQESSPSLTTNSLSVSHTSNQQCTVHYFSSLLLSFVYMWLLPLSPRKIVSLLRSALIGKSFLHTIFH